MRIIFISLLFLNIGLFVLEYRKGDTFVAQTQHAPLQIPEHAAQLRVVDRTSSGWADPQSVAEKTSPAVEGASSHPAAPPPVSLGEASAPAEVQHSPANAPPVSLGEASAQAEVQHSPANAPPVSLGEASAPAEVQHSPANAPPVSLGDTSSRVEQVRTQASTARADDTANIPTQESVAVPLCLRYGPIDQAEAHELLNEWFQRKGVKSLVQHTSKRGSSLHMVYLPEPDNVQRDKLIQKLRKRGFDDVRAVDLPEYGQGLSLGTYSQKERAKRHHQRVAAAGYWQVQIIPYSSESTLQYWLDVHFLDSQAPRYGRLRTDLKEGFPAHFPAEEISCVDE